MRAITAALTRTDIHCAPPGSVTLRLRRTLNLQRYVYAVLSEVDKDDTLVWWRQCKKSIDAWRKERQRQPQQ